MEDDGDGSSMASAMSSSRSVGVKVTSLLMGSDVSFARWPTEVEPDVSISTMKPLAVSECWFARMISSSTAVSSRE